MAKVTAAVAAMHLGSRHAVAAINRCRNRLVIDWLGEARPAGAAVEFRSGLEQRLTAPDAEKTAFPLFPVQRARTAWFGAVLAQHFELLGRQRLTPVVFGLLH